MLPLRVILLSCLAALAAWLTPSAGFAAGPELATGVLQATSRTGRFIVTMPASVATSPRARAANAAVGMIELTPDLVSVSCERVKDALNRILDTPASPGRSIHVTILPASATSSMPRLASTLYRDGWQHRLMLPTPLDEPAFISALVNVLLLQMVDRADAANPAEIPLWLATGLSLQVQAWNPQLLVRADVRGLNRERNLPDPLERARPVLATRPALSFDELSWPTRSDLGGDRGNSFKHSAHLFTERLLKLADGPALSRRFIASLSGHLNWQTAFLRVYARHFDSLLAVEKWWAVHVVAFTARDQWQTLPLLTALARLDETVLIEARVRGAQDSLPTNTTATLQTVISTWTGNQRSEGVQVALHRLMRLRPSVPATLVGLVDGYASVLAEAGKPMPSARPGQIPELHRNLLSRLNAQSGLPLGIQPMMGSAPQTAEPSVRALVRQLDLLDAQRVALREMSLQAARTSMAR